MKKSDQLEDFIENLSEKMKLKQMPVENYQESTNVMTSQGYEVVFGETPEREKFVEIRDHRTRLSDVLTPGIFEEVLYVAEFPFLTAPTWFTSVEAGANFLEATIMSFMPQVLTYMAFVTRKTYNALKGKDLGIIRKNPKIIGRKVEDVGQELGKYSKYIIKKILTKSEFLDEFRHYADTGKIKEDFE